MNLNFIISQSKKNNLYLLILLVFLSLKIGAQQITVKVLDSIEKLPLFGATVSDLKQVVTLTDNKGVFQLDNSQFLSNDTLFIDYLGYKTKKIVFKDLLHVENILLKDNFLSLNEVFIYKFSEKQENELIRKIIEKYERTIRKEAFLSNVHFSQIMSYNFQPKGFLEFDGKLFMPNISKTSHSEPEYWIHESRRTKENIDLNVFDKKNNIFRHLYFPFSRNTNLNYFSYLINHPLLSNNKNKYRLKISNSEIIDGNEYYVIEFRQIGDLEWVNRDLNDVTGVIYIAVENLEIYKEAFSYNWDTLSFSRFNVEYLKNEDGIIYPKYLNATYLSLEMNRKLMSECTLVFNSIPYKKIDNSMHSYFNLDLLVIKNLDFAKYNPEYWRKYPFEKNNYLEKIKIIIAEENVDSIFEKGANDPLLKNSSLINEKVLKESNEKYKKIKNYLE